MNSSKQPEPQGKKISMLLRIGLGLLGAAIAATGAHIFIGDAIGTAVAAVFFGLGVAITIGSGASDGGGGDAGGEG